jgi:hypothetical protein
MQPNYFSSGGCHNTILNFCRRVRDNVLFYTLPRDERIFKKDTKYCCRLTIYRITSPINIISHTKVATKVWYKVEYGSGIPPNETFLTFNSKELSTARVSERRARQRMLEITTRNIIFCNNFVKSCYKSLAKLSKIVLSTTCNKKSCCKK